MITSIGDGLLLGGPAHCVAYKQQVNGCPFPQAHMKPDVASLRQLCKTRSANSKQQKETESTMTRKCLSSSEY